MTHAFDIKRGRHLFFRRKTILVYTILVAGKGYVLYGLLQSFYDYTLETERLRVQASPASLGCGP